MKKKTAILAALCALSISTVSAYAADLLAFPGAEGGGKYTTGARGASSRSVYHVTNLNKEGTGSFKDAISKEGRVIVFDVGGVIELDSQLKINKSNLTILGQTAPGDGITFVGGDIGFGNGVSNVIMRHIRVRPTDEKIAEPDAIGGRWNHNIILDHCSMSWSVDEMMTLYAGSSEETGQTQGSNITVQNCIASESLRMSNHFKGAHGYGAIIGAMDSSWLNNLFAHHDSRSPRVDREVVNTDFSNNIIYNWGLTNSAYGAEPYSYNGVYATPSVVNWTNNYYKYGPGTAQKLWTRIFEVSNDNSKNNKSKFYFNGNYVYGSSEVTNNNTSDKAIKSVGNAELLTKEVDMGKYAYAEKTAEKAYEYVLENAGATLPKRDAIDARIVNDVKNQTGRIVNKVGEVGGLIPVTTTTKEFKIPTDWIQANGLSGYKETDIISSGTYAGYMLIEAYVNYWTEQQAKPSNPMITVLSPAIASINNKINGYTVNNGNWTVVNDNENITYNAIANAVNNVKVTKMELYDRNDLIKSWDNSKEIDYSFKLAPGEHYLTCRAYNEKGEMTQSTTSIVYVNSTVGAGNFKYTELGSSDFKDEGAAWRDRDTGIYTVAGAGKLFGEKGGITADTCGFMYKEVDGDFDIIVKMEKIPKFENYQVSGLMVRSSLDQGAVMAMLADGWLKYGENVRVISREGEGKESKVQYFTDQQNGNGTTINNDIKNYDCPYDDTNEKLSYDTSKPAFKLPEYMRITREGNTLTFYVSNSGEDWNDNTRQPFSITYSQLPDTMYIGIATDSAQGTPTKEYFAQAQYSGLTVNGEEDIIEDDEEDEDDGTFKAVSKPTKWVFDEFVKTFETDTLIGSYMLVHSQNNVTVDSNNKTINDVKYTTRLKFGGTANFDNDGLPNYRIIEILPDKDGMIEVAFGHASSNGDSRTMAVRQNGKEIATQSVDPNGTAYLSCRVEGGSSVYIYSKNSGLNVYGVYYIPIEVSSPYVSFVAAGGKTNSNTFYQSHIRCEGEYLWQYGNDGEGKGGRTYGNTISTGFTAGVKTISGASYDRISWDIKILVKGDWGDTFIKIPSSKSVSGNALMLSDMIDPGENYIPDIDYKDGAFEEVNIGEEMDPLDWGALSGSFPDWGMVDIPVSSEEEISVSDEPEFTEEQMMEFAEFAGSPEEYNADSAWEVTVKISKEAAITDEEYVTNNKGAIYKVESIDGDDTKEAFIRLQYGTTTFTGESEIKVGLIIDNLYAPSASASVSLYRPSVVIPDGYDDLGEKPNAIIANGYEDYLNQSS